jgi:catechol 2,3-dioxygenase
MQSMRSSPDFHKNPRGTFVDVDKLVGTRQAGMSFAELHKRAYADEFPPSHPMNMHDVIQLLIGL